MRRHERELFAQMADMIKGALNIWGDRPARLPSEDLWKHLAKDLLRRVESSRSGGSICPDAAPKPPSLDASRAGRERDAAGTLEHGIYEPHGFIR